MKQNYFKKRFNRFIDAWILAKPYWTSTEKYKAFFWLGVVIIFSLFEVYMAVWLNKWHVSFYNAIQDYNKVAFLKALFQGTYILILYVMIMLVGYYFNSILEVRWRKSLTHFYLNDWLDSKTYYKSRFTHTYSDNPDQRISEDIRDFIQLSLSLFMGVFKSIVSLASFAVILWGLSGQFKFNLLNHSFYIPGYMVWMAVLYAFLGTYITFKIGRPLIKLTYQQQKYEANFRYNLVRIREYAEQVASYDGIETEKKILTSDFDNIVTNFMQNINRNLKINMFNFAYIQFSNIVPTIISAGRYFSREITLGNMMQITSAFGQVQFSISYFIFAYSTFANWCAVIDRLVGFNQTIRDVKQLPNINIIPLEKNYLKVNGLQVKLPNNQILINDFSVTLQAGDRLLIQGPAGNGKTTLLKAMNELWPYTTGNIYKRPDLSSLFISQKPYLPKTNLREAICYPKMNFLSDDHEIMETLNQCGLGYLIDKLYHVCDWSESLSLGEQQKLAFCRMIINKPDILYLDEVSSALDENSEKHLYTEIIKHLPNTLIISVGHRSTLKSLHTMTLNLINDLKKGPAGELDPLEVLI
jgi:putative ATP-binding cassette transporter